MRGDGPDDAPRVLVVDDEPALLRAIKSVLTQQGYAFTPATTGEDAISLVVRERPDVMILDLTLPGASGLEVCRAVREFSDVPILILSVRDSEVDKIAALELGADDYLTKPFSPGELVARLGALLRRARPRDIGQKEKVSAGDLVIDLDTRIVRRGGVDAGLTRTEYDVLSVLARNHDRVVTTQTILDSVWGQTAGASTEALRVHVSHLRGKVEPTPSRPRIVVTEPGVGYRFVTGV